MADGIRLKPFDGKGDYSMWKVKMQAILTREKCWKGISEEWPALTSEEVKKDLKSLAYSEIIVRLSDDVVRQVLHYDDPKDLWKALDDLFLLKTLPNKISLLSRLFTYKMDTSLTLQENLDILLKLTQELKRCEEEIKDNHVAVILLNSLPSQFDTIKDVIQYTNQELTVSKIKEAIIQKNESLKVFKSKDQVKTEPKGEVMVVKGKPKGKGKGQKENKEDKTETKGKGKEIDKSQLKCFYCKLPGHFANECRKKLKADKNKEEKEKASGSKTGHTNVFEDELLMAAGLSNDSSWILDSGCTMHATPNKDLFRTLELNEKAGKVKLGDHTALEVKGIGSIPLIMHDGITRVIQNVSWVPSLRRNLLSESIFENMGAEIISKNGIRDVILNDKVVIKSLCKGGLYYVITKPEINAIDFHQDNKDITSLWHSRMGHIGNQGLSKLYTTGIIKEKPENVDFCETCIFGKKTAHSFEKSTMNIMKPIEYVSSDLWGPAPVAPVGGRKYFISFIDHFTRKVWIYLLKTKNEAFEYFSTWKTLVESQSNYKLKCIRTDNGLEFCNKSFEDFCKLHGIVHHLTVPGTPQQNGTAERMNRTILNKARCLLFSSGLKSSLWGEAVNTAVYLINRSPSSVIGFKTPQEMWTGHKPSVDYLKPFGCSAYAKVMQGKLEPRAIKCVMLGYPKGVKGYKL